MTLGGYGRKALGLSFLAVLSLMAVSAEASATTGKLLILNAAKTASSELHAILSTEVDLLLTLQIPAINLEIDCSKLTVEEGLYLIGGIIHAKVLFSGCVLYQLSPLTKIENCVVYPTVADRVAKTNKGNIRAEALLEVLKHVGADGEATVVRAKPKGEAFSHLFFENCPLSTARLITGGLTLLLHTDGHKVKHLFEEATGSFRLDQLKYGANEGNLIGSVWVFLVAEHAGLDWGLC